LLQSGDLNTKFFHQYTNHRCINKHLWEIIDDFCHVHKGQEEIMKEDEKHFKGFFNPIDNFSTLEQVEVVGFFNRWINEDEAHALYEPVS